MRRAGWYKDALEAIERLARRQRFLTSDDVRDELGDKTPPHMNAIGAVMTEAVKARTIIPTGQCVSSTRPEARGRKIQVHESRLYRKNDSLEDFLRHRCDGTQGSLEVGA